MELAKRLIELQIYERFGLSRRQICQIMGISAEELSALRKARYARQKEQSLHGPYISMKVNTGKIA